MIDLRLGDCLDIMRGLPDGCVGAVITDPPYGNGTNYGGYTDSPENLRELVSAFVPEARRIAKRVVLTSGVINMWMYPQPTWVLAWIAEGNVHSSWWGFQCWQPILVYGKDPMLQNRMGRHPDIIKFQDNKNINHNSLIAHPCPKPVGLMEKILRRTTVDNDTVLDPFMGSGTTGVACVKLNRNFIGIEINPDYFAIAQNRIAEAQKQMILL